MAKAKADLKADYVVEPLWGLLIPVEQVRTNPANARLHPAQSIKVIKDSLARFGQQKPIVIAEDGLVIAGEGTLIATMELGRPYIAAVRTNLPQVERMAYALADNRTNELSGFDYDALREQLSALKLEDVPIDDLGWEEDILQSLLGDSAGERQPVVEVEDTDHTAVQDESFWPEIKLRVSQLTYDSYQALMRTLDGDNDAEKFAVMVDLATEAGSQPAQIN